MLRRLRKINGCFAACPNVLVGLIAITLADVIPHILRFGTWYSKLNRFPVVAPCHYTSAELERLSHLMSLAFRVYPRRLPCLKRSIATMWFFRLFGAPASLVILARHMPFYSHATVEVDGHAVNETEIASTTAVVSNSYVIDRLSPERSIW
jgi:hypothetical protein